MILDIGSDVLSSDGQTVGRVDRIIYQPDTMTVREFVVHEGVFFTTDRIVARDLIDRVDEDHAVHLRITAEETADLAPFIANQPIPVFRRGELIGTGGVSVGTRPGTAPRDAVTLSHRSVVYDSTGKHVGHLDEVVYSDRGVATSFIVDVGRFFHHDVYVPLSAVHSITHERIELDVTADDLEPASRA